MPAWAVVVQYLQSPGEDGLSVHVTCLRCSLKKWNQKFQKIIV
ncbi:hypothetical protein CBM2589_A90173 [Cupriavidus taiwanensis]|uniref:Uncharacterized protein n=1 Tax=Cupriavidus taiwanensis TaxID=164546 RepID=A0A975XFU6_9BURK|nr:hypothetical protein CBM2589_A90173 [Cupriavidus taiwanensis]